MLVVGRQNSEPSANKTFLSASKESNHCWKEEEHFGPSVRQLGLNHQCWVVIVVGQ